MQKKKKYKTIVKTGKNSISSIANSIALEIFSNDQIPINFVLDNSAFWNTINNN